MRQANSRIWLIWAVIFVGCKARSGSGAAPPDSAGVAPSSSVPPRTRPLQPAAYSSDSTFDTTVVQDVRGDRRFDYVVRPQGPRFSLVLRGDSAYDQVAELLLFPAGDTVPVQRIEAMPEPPPHGERDVRFEDTNGDGYADLKLLGAWGTGGLVWWTWHFDPGTARLVPDSSAANPMM